MWNGEFSANLQQFQDIRSKKEIIRTNLNWKDQDKGRATFKISVSCNLTFELKLILKSDL